MAELRFEWDPKKDAANWRRHGVSFEEAQTAFSDSNGLVIPDPDHSAEEERFVLLGLSARLRALVVCHCLRHDGDTIRIISARRANRAEQTTYLGRRR